MIDLSKPLQLVPMDKSQTAKQMGPQPAVAHVWDQSLIVIRHNLSGATLPRLATFGYDGIRADLNAPKDNWRLENVPPPPVTYTSYGVWCNEHAKTPLLICFVCEAAANSYAKALGRRFIKREDFKITV
jgi:hypothetical protein